MEEQKKLESIVKITEHRDLDSIKHSLLLTIKNLLKYAQIFFIKKDSIGLAKKSKNFKYQKNINNADIAVYEIKNSGRNKLIIYKENYAWTARN